MAIRRCGLFGGSVLWGMGSLEVLAARAWAVYHRLFLLPADPDVDLSATSLAPCQPACCHAS